MKIGVENLTDRVQSGRAIYKASKKFTDLGEYLDTTLSEFYNFVRSIPYKQDHFYAEVVSRPKYALDRKKFPGIDCKKKAVLIGAWLNAHGIPWRAVAVSEKPDKKIHHVFVQAKIKGKYRNIDATYPEYNLFDPKPEVTAAEELPR